MKSKTVRTASAVPVGNGTAKVNNQITVRITSIGHRFVTAKLPGQRSGDSVVLGLRIDNQAAQPLDLNAAVVTLTDSAGDPATAITTDPATTFPNELAPGESATATYVFIVPKNRRDPVDIDVTVNADQQVVVFHGDVG
ncbi:DUF4352 domain-containing protein [Microlunatus elymi]|uniref:DUF4352 domain-containing protein n=1 Tax=Microlunatus elymi TaxID=2596828 RepID=A0A516PVH7_9ACTN|nr:DUF4352 domain-containing protein [Microlunatus elymi]QDP95169.1 DUF4352 domain-containing protein [Microlunatus elymi]